MRRTWIVLCVVVLIAGLVAGCATSTAIGNAREQLAKAKSAGADWSAPFEYNAADAYLKKAVFSAEIGDTKEANIFTKQSSDYSAKALGIAKGGAK
jgi:predicted small secreted protein